MDTINAIINNIKYLLAVSSRHILIIAAFIAAVSLSVLLLPKEVFEFFHIDDLRTNNLDKIGVAAFLATSTVILGSLYKMVGLVSNKLRNVLTSKQTKRELDNLFSGLSLNELLYLHLYIAHQTTLIEFDENDPIVASLTAKGLIYPSERVRIGHVVRFGRHFGHGQSFHVPPSVYNYLVLHPEFLSKVLTKDVLKD